MKEISSEPNYAAHLDQRVAVFIDTQNLYHSAKGKYRANVNYPELIANAVANRRLVRAFAYVIKSADGDEEKFFDALEQIGIEIRVKDLQVFHTGAKKADWDVGIAVDMIRLTEKVDVIVLASGDGDFLEVMRFCQSRGVRVEVMAFEETTNAKLAEEADLFINLSDDNFLLNRRRFRAPKAVRTAASDDLNLPAYLRKTTSDKPVEDVFRKASGGRVSKPASGTQPHHSKPAPLPKRRFGDDQYGIENAFGNKPKW